MSTNALYTRISTSFKKQGFLSLIGAELTHVEHGKVIVECRHRDELTQQQGLLHGGVVASLADVACGYAALTTIPEEKDVLTVEFKLNLIRPASSSKVIATGQVIRTGKTLVIAEAVVTDESGANTLAKMLATLIATQPR